MTTKDESMVGSTHPSRARSLAIVAVAYATALVAGGLTLALAPIEDPIARTFAADLVATAVIFLWSWGCNNSSLYDAFWSVIPIAIVIYWMGLAESGVPPLRSAAVFGVVLAWGWRLTYSWARGWSGLDHEDWRYAAFREGTGRFYWPVSFAAIHLFPTLIVFAGLLAAWPALVTSNAAIGWIDGLAVAVGVCGIALEWIADRQLHAFVTGPRQPGETLRTGLWRHSRHPNYLGEISIWWSLYLFGLAADPGWARWALLAPLAMTAMFCFVSIPLLEKRSLERRAGYQTIIDETRMLLPIPRRSRTG